ncbi:MAG: hypothetical protein ABR977_08110 [Candidatus Dormibacteria bacterium]|jgi:hypothetical protein
MSIERKHSDRRGLRAGMVFVLVLAGTALIGWGGLAAWQAVTQNNGSTASTLGVHHSNVATVTGGTPVACTDQTSPSACGAIFDATGIYPTWGPTQVGTVTITNTGSEASTFQLALKSATVSGDDSYWTAADNTLCADLTLTIKDAESTPHVLYSGPLSAMTNFAIADNGGNAVWNPGATDTFAFTLALGANANTDEDSVCTAAFTWGQNGA